ncbi:bifunctional diguanylate cyclase/phosphodiesterase [Ahniella affigens]|uniref:Bifunctional diguanylate cyclase/phosphodiesterase n=1 Tax=Ahniella affigens TaxID=2021234 RepID=A0A2P1PVI3_9GAMM|nr:bifunctional diguanylate cyclase/phosphodiesterase [Ahniella affigens]
MPTIACKAASVQTRHVIQPAPFADRSSGGPIRAQADGRALALELLHAQTLPALADCLHQYAREALQATATQLHWSEGFSASGPSPRQSAPVALGERTIVAVELFEQAWDQGRSASKLTPDGVELALPIIAGSGTSARAVLCLKQSTSGAELAADTLNLIAARAQELLQTSRLKQAVDRLETAERIQRALYAIADLASSDMEMPDMLSGIHEIIGDLTYAENFYIGLFDRDLRIFRFIYFADSVDPDPTLPDQAFTEDDLKNSLTLALMRHGKPLMGPSMTIRNLLGVTRDASFGPDAEDWLGIPLITSGVVCGALVVQSYDASVRYTETDRALLSYVGQHVLTAVQRKQAHAELERRVEERTRELVEQIEVRKRRERLQAAFQRIAELTSSTETIDQFYTAVHGVVGELLYAKNFFIALLEGEWIVFPYAVDERDPSARFESRRPGLSLTDHVLRTQKPLLADREQLDQLNERGVVKTVGSPSVCWLGVPLRGETGPLGVMAVQSYSPEVVYDATDQEVLTFVANHIALAIERKRAQDAIRAAKEELEKRVEERTRELAESNLQLRDQIKVRQQIEMRLKHEALHDALTGLPNRSLLLDRMSQCLNRLRRDVRRHFAVLFLDLDRFKVINDSVGHLIGDELLKEASRRLQACVREPDTVARLGGDEFAILIEDVSDIEDTRRVARRVITALNEPIRVAGKELFTSASIGIAMGESRYNAPEELLRDADVAMYRAKAKGRQRFEVFDETLHQEALNLLTLESDLRRAIARSEFEPFFQPIIDIDHDRIVGYEALLRWNHPDRGLLLPSDFLSVAEDNGSAEIIDWQLFEQAMRAVPRLAVMGRYVSVNVSARHLRDPHWHEEFFRLLELNRVKPEQVRVEVTEGALLENPEQIRHTLNQMRDRGLHALLDDFGTGYSSLSYLHQFPMDALKIDKSFVRDLKPGGSGGNVAVVRAILALAGTLGVKVIAEGIEKEEQRDALRELGCSMGQGFWYAHPQPLSRFQQAAASNG